MYKDNVEGLKKKRENLQNIGKLLRRQKATKD